MLFRFLRAAPVTAIAIFLAGEVNAGELALADLAEPTAVCDLFDQTTLYRNETADFLQQASLIGRYEGQWH